MDKKLVSNRLKELRAANKLNQDKFAEKINMSKEAVQKWEQGKNVLTLDNAIEIAQLFDVSLDWLYGTTDELNNDAAKVLIALNKYFNIFVDDNGHLTAEINNTVIDYFQKLHEAESIKSNISSEVFKVLINGLTENFRNVIKSTDLSSTTKYIMLTPDELEQAIERGIEREIILENMSLNEKMIYANENPDEKDAVLNAIETAARRQDKKRGAKVRY